MKNYLLALIGLFIFSCKKEEFNRQQMLSNIAENSVSLALTEFNARSIKLLDVLNKLIAELNQKNLDLVA